MIPAFALVDNDGDGMSDVWEDVHDFSTTDNGSAVPGQAPHADLDGDGYSNLKESIMGTDPQSGQPSVGFVVPAVVQQPSLSGVYVVSWPTQKGKQYRLHASPDLSVGSWTQVGDAILGDGTPIEIAIQSDAAALFWRVAVEDLDRDADGLSDYEEGLLGSDPLLVDSDGDGVADAAERNAGMDAHAADHPDLKLSITIQ
jgi:hypothetical protein